ncbi:MAG: phosphoadenosine phosphosulfate reductase family protein [Lachnospiraceae bacterium]|nr:phosphoadenosine phosphosulfate reductase family protein [Lachnospiraceae bacterium]
MRGQISIFDGTEQSLLNKNIKLIQEFERSALMRNPLGYVVGYSGGKDSDVLVSLFIRAGVKFCIVHNHTTLDMPETVYYIKRKFAKWEQQGIPCKIYYPNTNFWSLCLQKKMLPQRQFRFCCAMLKEAQIPELKQSVRSFGVRKAESKKRLLLRDSIETRNREDYSDQQRFHFDDTEQVKEIGACYTNNYFIVNPLAYWSDDYLWDYIESEKIEINPLYHCGFSRIGCIGCPMAGVEGRIKEFERYPKFKNRFIKLCNDITQLRNIQTTNKKSFKSGTEYFEWWINNGKSINAEEYNLFSFGEEV